MSHVYTPVAVAAEIADSRAVSHYPVCFPVISVQLDLTSEWRRFYGINPVEKQAVLMISPDSDAALLVTMHERFQVRVNLKAMLGEGVEPTAENIIRQVSLANGRIRLDDGRHVAHVQSGFWRIGPETAWQEDRYVPLPSRVERVRE